MLKKIHQWRKTLRNTASLTCFDQWKERKIWCYDLWGYLKWMPTQHQTQHTLNIQLKSNIHLTGWTHGFLFQFCFSQISHNFVCPFYRLLFMNIYFMMWLLDKFASFSWNSDIFYLGKSLLLVYVVSQF